MSNEAIAKKFVELAAKGEKAYIPYVCCGDGGIDFTKALVRTLVEGGADLLELGIPFSDTLADGQTIQEASERALKNGMNVDKAFNLLEELRGEGISIPVLPMTYYNLVFHYGVERFCARAAEAGVSGLLIPDLPFEESGRLKRACEDNGMVLIYFIAPTTSEGRMRKILSAASGFVYAVAVMGVTGARESFEDEAKQLILRAKQISQIPVAVGFGISTPEHATAAAEAGADAVVEGSQLIKIYAQSANAFDSLENVKAHAKEMKNALCSLKLH